MLRRLPCSKPLLYQDVERETLSDEILYFLATKLAVGTVLPIMLHDLIDSKDVDKRDESIVTAV